MLKKSIVTSSTKEAECWDVAGLTLQRDCILVTIAGFWDEAHYHSYVTSSNIGPADIKSYIIPTDILDSANNKVLELAQEGVSFRNIGKTLIEDYLIATDSEWTGAVRQ